MVIFVPNILQKSDKKIHRTAWLIPQNHAKKGLHGIFWGNYPILTALLLSISRLWNHLALNQVSSDLGETFLFRIRSKWENYGVIIPSYLGDPH